MPKRSELAIAAAALAVLGAAVFGSQVANGGFYWDDWQNAANVHFAHGFFHSVDMATKRPVFGYRPVLAELLVVKHSITGESKPGEIAFAVGFGVLTAWALFWLLRSVGVGTLESGAAAALLLLFPWADSTRIWPTASMDTLAVAFFLLGAVLAVRALRTGGRWTALLSAVLYLAACWTYEVAVAPILACVLLYLVVAARRAALRRFALDVGTVALALYVNVTGTTRHPQAFDAELRHARAIGGQLVTLLGRAMIPVGATPWWIGAALLAASLGGGVLAWRRVPRVRPCLALAGFGAVAVAAGYVLYVPAEAYYRPLSPGTVTRMNSFGALGYAVLVVGLVSAVATLAVRSPKARAAAVAVVCAAIGAGYVVKVAHDERDWQRSASEQAHVLATIRRAVPHPAPGLTMYSFGARSFAAPSVPVFSLPFDLKAAVRLAYDDMRIAAYPIRGADVLECGPSYLYPHGGTYGLPHRASYGRAVFVDVKTGRAIPIDSRAECVEWRARLGAAPA